MSELNLFKIYQLFEFEINGQINRNVLNMLQSWTLIPKEGDYKCPRGHTMQIYPRTNIDGFIWR